MSKVEELFISQNALPVFNFFEFSVIFSSCLSFSVQIVIQLPVHCGRYNSTSCSWIERESISGTMAVVRHKESRFVPCPFLIPRPENKTLVGSAVITQSGHRENVLKPHSLIEYVFPSVRANCQPPARPESSSSLSLSISAASSSGRMCLFNGKWCQALSLWVWHGRGAPLLAVPAVCRSCEYPEVTGWVSWQPDKVPVWPSHFSVGPDSRVAPPKSHTYTVSHTNTHT